MAMSKRDLLWQAIKYMFVLVAFAFMFVLFRSLGGPSHTSGSVATYDDVVIGQTALRRNQHQRVWVTRLSDIQRQQLKQLDEFVKQPDAGCHVQMIVCVVKASTSRDGIDVAFSERAPAQLSGQVLWFGGYVDPTTGAVFDRLGRAYKNARSTDERLALELVH